MSSDVIVSNEITLSVVRLAALWAELQNSLDPASEINGVEINESALAIGALFINSLKGGLVEDFKVLCNGTVIKVPASDIGEWEGMAGVTIIPPEQDGVYNVCVAKRFYEPVAPLGGGRLRT
jgi:hypothetical protein